MPAILNEHQQWIDDGGKPYVGGRVYVGEQGADPKVSPQDIFAERSFDTPIANPQPIDSTGRTENKMWVKGRYSILVEDLNGVQVYQELDNGEPEEAGIVIIDNVQGATDIVGTGSPTVTAYVDKEIYIFKTVSINGTPVTLDIDEVGAKSVTFPDNAELKDGQWGANQNVAVIYNSTSDSFIFDQHNEITLAEIQDGTSDVPGLTSALSLRSSLNPIETDMRLNFLLTAENSGTRVNLLNGIADAYMNEDDVDLVATTAAYDAPGNFYFSGGGFSGDQIPTMTGPTTPTGQASASSETGGNDAWNAMDDSGTTHWTANAQPTNAWLQYDFGSGADIIASRYTLDSTDISFTDRMPRDFELQGSNNGTDWDVLDSRPNETGWGASEVRTYDFVNAVSYRFYRVFVNAVQGGGATTEIGEWELEIALATDVIVQSNAFTAEAQYDRGKLHVQIREISGVIINTDLIGRVSRDDGTTWTDAVLVRTAPLADGTVAFEDASIDISGQPAGTDMKYQIETFNDKSIEIHGTVLQWGD